EMGEVERAIERLRHLADQAESLGMRWQTRICAQNLAVCLHRAGRYAEASEVAEQAAALALEAGDPVLRANALSLRADALHRVGELEAALESATLAEGLQRAR